MARATLRRISFLALALATIVAGAFAVPARADSAASALRRAQARWRAYLLADRPDLSMRYGVRGAEDRLALLSESGLDSARARLSRLREGSARLNRSTLSSAELAASDTLAARIEREWTLIERGAWRQEPGLYAALTLDAVLEVAAKRKGITPCERSRRALYRLRAVPEALRAASINLRGAADFDREQTLSRWNDAIQRLRTELPVTLLACREPHRVAEAVEADSAALDAAQRFVRFVREDLVQSARTR